MKNMMKLILALVLVLTMVGGCVALAEEDPDYREQYPESLVYESDWGCGGMMLSVICEDGGFRAMVTQRAGEMLDDRIVWEYAPLYDAESKTLISLFGSKTYETYDEDGEFVKSETLYEDGSATFSLLENGHLVWNDEVEDAGKGMEFVKLGRFQGNYVCGRCQIEILWDADDVYVISIHWGGSAFESANWAMTGVYNPETDTLEAVGMETIFTYDENGDFVSARDVDEEGCFASFFFNGEHQLIWNNSDGAADGMLFEDENNIF